MTSPRSYIMSGAVRTRIHLTCNLTEAWSSWVRESGRGWLQRMAYLPLGGSGPGTHGGEESVVFSSGVAKGIRGTASWELSSCPPGPGPGKAPCGLMCGVSTSLGSLSRRGCPQLSKVQEGSTGCTLSAPSAAW